MTPQAEIWVPRTVGKKDLENLLKPIGGRIDMFLESKRIPVRKISLSPMAAFFKEFYPSLKLDPVPTYPEIFSELRDLPPDEQEKLLVGFYSQKVEAFPNGAELGRFLARINNISWFQPKSPPDRKSLKGLCHQTLSRLNHPDLTLRIIKEDWDMALYAARNPAQDAIQAVITLGAVLDADGDPTRGPVSDEVLDVARDAKWATARDAARDAGAHDVTRGTIEHVVWEAAQDAAREAAQDAARGAAQGATQEDAAGDALEASEREIFQAGQWWLAEGAVQGAKEDAADSAVRGAEWIVVKDLMPHRGYNKGNPFEPLVKIYELGCWPIGIVPDQNGEKKFVVFVPPIQKIT